MRGKQSRAEGGSQSVRNVPSAKLPRTQKKAKELPKLGHPLAATSFRTRENNEKKDGRRNLWRDGVGRARGGWLGRPSGGGIACKRKKRVHRGREGRRRDARTAGWTSRRARRRAEEMARERKGTTASARGPSGKSREARSQAARSICPRPPKAGRGTERRSARTRQGAVGARAAWWHAPRRNRRSPPRSRALRCAQPRHRGACTVAMRRRDRPGSRHRRPRLRPRLRGALSTPDALDPPPPTCTSSRPGRRR